MKPRIRCEIDRPNGYVRVTHYTGFEGDTLFVDPSGKRRNRMLIDTDRGCAGLHPLPWNYDAAVSEFLRAIQRQ